MLGPSGCGKTTLLSCLAGEVGGSTRCPKNYELLSGEIVTGDAHKMRCECVPQQA